MRRAIRAGICMAALAVIAFVVSAASSRIPEMAANGLLHPPRRAVLPSMPGNCEAVAFSGVGVVLQGWRCRAGRPPRATIIYLHGVADNRGSATNIIARYTGKGFDVIAYDSRAHGESEGLLCSYGYFEKEDLLRVIGLIDRGPIVLIGTSLGAAVAIQAAASNPTIATVVAAETFSDLQTVARERAPWMLTDAMIKRAFALVEMSGRFEVDAVSPEQAAKEVHAPVLLIHGTDDHETPADHSRRVMSALAGPKRLILVERAGHNESLQQEEIWAEIDKWIEQIIDSR